jgi:hypothetical protein
MIVLPAKGFHVNGNIPQKQSNYLQKNVDMSGTFGKIIGVEASDWFVSGLSRGV